MMLLARHISSSLLLPPPLHDRRRVTKPSDISTSFLDLRHNRNDVPPTVHTSTVESHRFTEEHKVMITASAIDQALTPVLCLLGRSETG